MRNTKWMVLCLFLGFLMAAGMMSTVPIYMDASLQRVFIKEMEEYQLNTGYYPGRYIVSGSYGVGIDPDTLQSVFNDFPPMVASRANRVGMPIENSKIVVSDNLLYLTYGDTSSRVRVTAMSGVEQHITMLQGDLYSGGVSPDGSYEVIVSEDAARTLGVICGNTYTVSGMESSQENFTVTVTGIFTQSDLNDTYWSEDLLNYVSSIFVPYDLYSDMIAKRQVNIADISANYNFDYHRINMNSIESVSAAITDDAAYYSRFNLKLTMGSSYILQSYVERASRLTAMLWAIQIPTMVMLAFYLFMVSQLNVEQERGEIAVLKSRGSSPRQIFALYAMEAGVLGIVTFLTAPLIGLLLCRFLGVSDGFMEFVNRTGIAAKLSLTAFLYSFVAVAVFFITTILPIIPASKLTIVQYKQSRTKVSKTSLWEYCGIDIVLIGFSVAFWYLYRYYTDKAVANGTFAATGQIDPLIFIFSTCMIVGMGLLFIRLYPYLLKLIYFIGRPFWTPTQYMSLTTVSCAGGSRERFLMLFLILTFACGLFSANTARAINNNKEDMIYYQNGADVTLMEYWTEQQNPDGITSTYQERDFSRFEELAGVESATKVLSVDSTRVNSNGRELTNVVMMAIEPEKFARTAWFRDDLLPIHWYNYCNALTNYSTGVLISDQLAENAGIEIGDDISVKWSGNDSLTATVIAIVDWWPGINPGEFCVLNYNYVYNSTTLEPYYVWLKLADGASSEELYRDISEKRLPIQSLTDSAQLLIREKNQPTLQGMNGGLTLGFIITMIMAIVGFLIYWILSIKGRTLQFGILRAMGMTMREIITMLGYEQILVSGVSIAMAFIIGGITSDIFVPVFQSMYALSDQIPPFIVSASAGDYIKIYVLIAIMLVGGFMILGGIIRKININKALKLGED
ncbi:MAG: FtsX-like permease family protein [Oscillospiraceae bacterium]|nr:FtsX-like permease family protein [Oscillospiraceae bacterium]